MLKFIPEKEHLQEVFIHYFIMKKTVAKVSAYFARPMTNMHNFRLPVIFGLNASKITTLV